MNIVWLSLSKTLYYVHELLNLALEKTTYGKSLSTKRDHSPHKKERINIGDKTTSIFQN